MSARLLLALCTVALALAAEPRPLFRRGSTFCHVLHTGSGLRYLSFLHRGPDRLLLYQSTWAAAGGRRLLDCAVREEEELVRVYLAACAERIGGNLSAAGSHRQSLRELERSRHRCSRGPGVRAKRALEEAEPGTGAARRRSRRGWTVPGTLWCGAGDSAGNFTDLGIFTGADLCCREHDHCAERLTAFEFNYGIRNYRLHTISHCDCDYRFKQCLHDVNDTVSTFVGITFFNLLEMPCLVLEEKEECMEWHWWGGCKKYGPVPFAEIKKQGNFNYSHPFSDKLDERYRPNRTEPAPPPVGSSTHLTSSDAEPGGASSSASGVKGPRPDKKGKRERRKRKKNAKHLLQETAQEPELVPRQGKEDSAAVTKPELPTTMVPKIKTDTSLSEVTAVFRPEVPSISASQELVLSLPETPGFPQSKVFSNHLNELHPLIEKPQSYMPSKNQDVRSNRSSISIGKEDQTDPVVAGLEHTALGEVPEGKDRLSQSPEKSLTLIKSNIIVNVKDEPIGNASSGQQLSVAHHHPHKNKMNQRYISKSCGCYQRLDQCEYKIAPNEMKFQLHNPDLKTLFHCNCTQRLARFLRRKKGHSEVEDVLSDFVSPYCFALQPLVTCKKEQETETSCTSVPVAVLSKARHLQRAMRLLQASKTHRAPGKVKRQDWAPLKLYDTCLQRVGASLGHQENLQTSTH